MIPIGDNVAREHYPFVTHALIGLNVWFFSIELGQGPAIEPFIATWAVVPARLMLWHQSPWVLITLLTGMFLHAGWLHIIGNMIFLGVFGRSVEDDMGHGRFLLLYLAAGVTATLAQVAATPASTVPELGASGAIAGALGAYLLLFPRAQVFILIPLLIFFPVLVFPAWFVLIWWFLIQLVSGLHDLGSIQSATGGVAYWAHVGGFIFGAAFALPLARGRPHRIRYYDPVHGLTHLGGGGGSTPAPR